MTKICPKCKKENQDTSLFCKECGSELTSPKKSENLRSKGGLTGWWGKQDSKGKALTLISGCCVGLILIIAISGMFASDKNTATTSTPQTTNTTQNTQTTPTTSASASYKNITVGGLKCEIDNYLAGGESKSLTGKSVYNSPGETITIEVYTDSSSYQEAINFAADEPGTKKVTTTISGHQVTSYDATDYEGKSYVTYFFEVNGKQICVMQDGTSVDKHLVESFYNLN